MTNLMAIGLSLVAAAAATAADKPPSLRVTTKRADDRADVTAETGKAVVSIRSPFGISQAVVARSGEAWPDAVVLRLHLKGLENFQATNGKVTLRASASAQDGKPLVRVWQDGKEDAPLDARSPYWIDVRALAGDATKDGYFELALPRAFFADNPKAVTVNWIDFYRN